VSDSAQDPARPIRPSGTDANVSLRVASSELFHGKREVVIVHGDQEYRLSISKADKLILTK
jgi:hemin uptake protein HemP